MLWSTSKLARARQSAPSGFIVPCQPTLSACAPAGAGWIHEIKHDGYRLVARRDPDRLRLWSRNMTDYTRAFGRIADAVASLSTDVLLDGEAVVLHADGHSRFDGLRSKAGGADAVMIAFDLLEIDGRDLRGEPLHQRRAMLSKILKNAPDGLMLSETIEGDGPTIFRHACELGLEGIVSKRTGSKYRSGRSTDWLKTKNPLFERR